MKELVLVRLEPTLVKITCVGGKVKDIKSGAVFSSIIKKVEEWMTDEQILSGYEGV